MQTIPPLSFKEIVLNFDAALVAADDADNLYERGDRPETELANNLSAAIDAACRAAERVLAQPATTVDELKDKTRALIYRWRSSDFDPNLAADDPDYAGFYGGGALPALTNLMEDIATMA